MDNKQLIGQYCQQFKMGGILHQIDQLIMQAEANATGYLEYTARLLGAEAEHRQQNEIKKRLKGRIDLSMAVALNDIKAQLAGLMYAGFVRDTPALWLQEYPRYLKAIEQRLDKLPSQVQQDRVWTLELTGYLDKLKKRQTKHAQEGQYDEALTLYRWMLEEYRVSLFAQQLGTKVAVSDKRLSKQWSSVTD